MRIDQASSQLWPSTSLERRNSSRVGEAESKRRDPADKSVGLEKPLSREDQQQVEHLKRRDAEVRAHEAAHAGAAAGLGGSPSYSYQQGPDGRRYAIGGEVQVQLQRGSTPEETIRNAQTVRSAAMAPAQPSGQDRGVAAAAAAMEAEARMELQKAKQETRGTDDPLVLAKLETERRQTYGSRGHEHVQTSCGFCARAVSRYG